MDEIITLIQKTYGLAGLLILSPAVALYIVYRDKKAVEERHDKDLAAANEKVTKVHEQRVADAQTFNGKLLDLVKEQTALNTETNAALEKISDKLVDLRQVRT